MLDDDLADSIGVDESDVKDKGDKVVMKDHWLEVKVGGDESPSDKIWDEAIEWGVQRLLLLLADVEDVLYAAMIDQSRLGTMI